MAARYTAAGNRAVTKIYPGAPHVCVLRSLTKANRPGSDDHLQQTRPGVCRCDDSVYQGIALERRQIPYVLLCSAH
ncbi:hypothetical protein BCR37DRAFT_121349 [Protomyces lactucae-debilis]|uniref:Uncharacterized protein n=1 Tax=Protomyces lactucae-debilis TaxID=2754530 RepID=A0A1Y2F234_PROLT|nr:uncharacterized protein BCR37DRAFT_121349 [Protomyces lactucae-debilis]ORY77757.1 hypothetical protein BCR37DRAFT_121349 [Protomyces lactucae-debilis]